MSSLLQDNQQFCNQNYVLGKDALQRLAQSKIFLSGLGSMGVEIAKNLLSTGVSHLTLQDHTVATHNDLSGQFLFTVDDVNTHQNRAEVSRVKLASLNPHATIESISTPLEEYYLNLINENYDCIILTEVGLELQKLINRLCRTHDPPIKFLSADTFGFLGSLFCDFGDVFSVLHPDAEEAEELHVSHISKSNPGIVRCHDSCKLSGYRTGDLVKISCIQGMSAVNDRPLSIEVLGPNSFSICDTTLPNYREYIGGGIIRKLKTPVKIHFESLEKQIHKPKLFFPSQESMTGFYLAHLAWLALQSFIELHGRHPYSWNEEDAEEMFEHAVNIQDQQCHFQISLDKKMIMALALTCNGYLSPLTTVMGGFCAQEVVKAVTGKYMPIQQWLHLNYTELFSSDILGHSLVSNDRYSGVRICLGDDMLHKLQALKLFIVGCSAVANEYLKIAAFLGIGSLFGKIVLADDACAKNLNIGQFFWLPKNIAESKPLKATVMVQAAKSVNPAIHIETVLHKVCPDKADIFNESFFNDQKIVMTALDTMESRRHIDTLCVKHSLPLIDCGTAGTMGHVQVVIPHHSESFSCKFDPSDPDYPYCVLKSFPTKLEHTVQWAREKFENYFLLKPNAFNNFWAENDPQVVFQNLENSIVQENLSLVIKLLSKLPKDFSDCIRFARLQYEKYFVNKAKQLLQNFPENLTLADGSSFWQYPKLLPVPLMFDITNEMHMKFVTSMACLIAYMSGITPIEHKNMSAFVRSVVVTVAVPEFVPKNKQIVTDENTSKPETSNIDDEVDAVAVAKQLVLLLSNRINSGKKYLHIVNFETKGQEEAVHNFIVSAATLRAQMYTIKISCSDRINAIARKLVPFLPTTTAITGGLAMLELLKMLRGLPHVIHRNHFFNLAVPKVVVSSPSPAKVMSLSSGIQFTLWDRWPVYGSSSFTLRQLLEELKIKAGSEVSLVAEGTKMIYMPLFFSHKKRLDQPMAVLLQENSLHSYVELTVSYESPQIGEDDVMGPPVKYHFRP